MNPETQASLQALEKELGRLRSAVEHIEQAKAVAQKVVAAVGLIQKKYGEHLDALLDAQKQAAERLGEGSQERFEEISAGARRHILESAARAKKYLEEYNAQAQKLFDAAGSMAGEQVESIAGKASEVVEEAGRSLEKLTVRAAKIVEAAGEQLSGAISESGAQMQQDVQETLGGMKAEMQQLHATASGIVQQAGAVAAKKIEESAGKTTAAFEQLDGIVRRHVEEVAALAKESLQEIMLLARENVEDAGNQSKRIFAAIKKTHDQQITEFEKVTVSTDALIAASGKLVRTIDAIDFPRRLEKIESDIHSLHYNLNSAMSRLDVLETSTQKAMAAMGEDIVNKLGRLEMFTEKTVRTFSDSSEKRFDEQEKEIKGTKTLVVILLIINLALAAGLYLIWSDAQPAPQPPSQVVSDTTDTLLQSVEESAR